MCLFICEFSTRGLKQRDVTTANNEAPQITRHTYLYQKARAQLKTSSYPAKLKILLKGHINKAVELIIFDVLNKTTFAFIICHYRHISDEPDDDWDRMSMLRRMSLTVMNAFGLAPPNQKYGNSVINVQPNLSKRPFLNKDHLPTTTTILTSGVPYLE